MPGNGPKYYPCVLCNKRTKPHERRPINKSVAKYLNKNFLITPKQEDKICNTCKHKYYVQETKHSSAVQHRLSDDEDYVPPAKRRSTVLSSPPSVSLSIPSTSKSHSYCFICKKPGPKLIVVQSQARFSTFLKKEVIIPAGCRCCPGHLMEDNFTEDAISKINCTNDNVLLNRSSIMDLLKKLRSMAIQNEQSRIDFDTDKVLSDFDFINLTGINKDNFNDLLSYIKDLVRWVVESANARIKRWKYLSHVLPNKQVPYIGDYVCIVCGISNKYLPPLSPGCDNEEVLAAKMLHLSKNVNTLKQRVEEENFERRKTIWKEPDNNLDDFPRLDEEDLRNITCGVYQIKLSTSYIQEHLEGNCQILVHQEDEHLIRVKLQSRHVSSKSYILWIEYTSAEITAWYCKCRAGARVVGLTVVESSLSSFPLTASVSSF
ncbi:unnamed protein product [Mytilus coruscus]|uniref:Uncharacterized protein n=1 Tax=Mytilus coruscus TaxID=42192 RepID=A0A6J8BZM2_MYTCO|nr:unnamed protein product [Mytilus coruscus]